MPPPPAKPGSESPPGAAGRLSLRDIATRCGVSVATVSKALKPNLGDGDLNPETRLRVRQTAEAMGWRTHLRQSAHATTGPAIGLVYSSEAPIFHGIYYSAGFRFAQTLAQRGAKARLLALPDPGRWRTTLAEQPIVGAVLMEPVNALLADLLWDLRFPAVVLNHPLGSPIPQVLCDDWAGIAAAMRALIDRGHRRIAWVQASQWWHLVIAEKRRLAAHQAAAAAGIDLSELTYVEPRETRDLLQQHQPTAVVTFNATDAMYVLRAATHLGWPVPGRLSIIAGDDGAELTRLPCTISGVSIPILAMMDRAIDLVLGHLHGTPLTGDQRVVVPPELVLRESIGPVGRDDQQL